MSSVLGTVPDIPEETEEFVVISTEEQNPIRKKTIWGRPQCAMNVKQPIPAIPRSLTEELQPSSSSVEEEYLEYGDTPPDVLRYEPLHEGFKTCKSRKKIVLNKPRSFDLTVNDVSSQEQLEES